MRVRSCVALLLLVVLLALVLALLAFTGMFVWRDGQVA